MSQHKQEHDDITKQFYVDKTMSKETFERLHMVNSLKDIRDNGKTPEERKAAKDRLDALG